MPSPGARCLALIALSTPLSCGLFGGGRSTTPHAGNPAGVHSYTDSDAVTSVAGTPAGVFVGTARGVLRYPAAGGAPTRIRRAEGLPDDRVLALAASSDGAVVWAATPRGVARFDGSHWSVAGDPQAQADVGTATALLALGGNDVLLGGTQGLARFDGTRWTRLSDRIQVVSMASDQGRPLIATAQSGIVVLRGDLVSTDVFDTQSGIPEPMVRNVVPVGNGRFWALLHGAGGAKLTYFDGQRFYGYTSEHVRDPWVALVPNANHTSASLLTPGGMFDITQRGDELIPTEASPVAGSHRVELHPTVIEAPPPPPPPAVEPPPAPPTRGHGHGARPPTGGAGHAATGATTAGHAAAGATTAGHAAAGATTAGHAAAAPHGAPAARGQHAPLVNAERSAQSSPRTAPRDTTPSATGYSDAGATAVNAPDARAGNASTADAGVAAANSADVATASTAPTASTASTAPIASTAPAAPAMRAVNVPAPAGPVDVPRGGPAIEAPTFGLERSARVSVADDVVGAYADAAGGVFVARLALGATRVAGGATTDFREHDLALRDVSLSLATDPDHGTWLALDDASAIRYDGVRFVHANIDPDPAVVPLMFYSHGSTVAAVGRVGNNVLRIYRWQGRGWHAITDRPIDTRGAGTVRARFLAVDDASRYWVGIRVTRPEGQGGSVDLGVAVLDEAHPAATQFNAQVPPEGAEQGAKPAPDDLTRVTFDAQGAAWFAGLSGATRIALPPGGGDATVQTYSESSGLRGDVVNDLARGPNDRIFIASTEGLGYWDGAHWQYDLPGSGSAPRVIALAADASGGIWGAGTHGAWVFDGQRFRMVGHADGLPGDAFTDVGIDGENRAWFVSEDGVSVVPVSHVAPSASTGGGNGGT